jgi:uncharacterized coiled-coil DUF342 family protein
MLRNGRRVLIAPGWVHARQQFAALVAERDELRHERDMLKRNLAWVEQNNTELRGTITEMLAARQAVKRAHAELTELYRQRDLERARAAVRDPTTLLN